MKLINELAEPAPEYDRRHPGPFNCRRVPVSGALGFVIIGEYADGRMMYRPVVGGSANYCERYTLDEAMAVIEKCLESERIAVARLRSGLTQAQAAAIVGVSRRTWQRWEAGDTRMPVAASQLFEIKSDEKK